MTLTEFLLARISDDELMVPAGRASEDYGTGFNLDSVTVEVALPRWLAECAAERRIIDAAWSDQVRIEGEWGMGASRDEMSADNDNPEVLQAMALPYSSHADYQPEWTS